MRYGLGLALSGERVYAAGRGGEVAAFDAATGRAVWRARTKAALSAGVGVDETHVAVGSSDGEVVLLNAADGNIMWRAKVGGEVLAAPALAAGAVVVRTVDGRLRGLSLEDGKELWQVDEQIPRLTLRGNAAPVVAGDLAIAGFDNGKVIAVSTGSGDTVWETPVIPARGRTELERLVDIDAAVKVLGEEVFVAGYQGRAAMLALESGQIWWTREVSSYRGVDVDDDAVYVATADGEVVALRRRSGVELWRQSSLKFRKLSAPAAAGDYVAVADFAGIMHWFDKSTGAPAARTGGLGGRVSNPLVAAGDVVYVISDNGRISALRAASTGASAPAATPAPDAATPEVPPAAPAAPDATLPSEPAPEATAPAAPAEPLPNN
jgi:outer membrane protein assembly factor BamB